MISRKLANDSHSHFTDKETERRRLSGLPKVTELVRVRIKAGASYSSQSALLSLISERFILRGPVLQLTQVCSERSHRFEFWSRI